MSKSRIIITGFAIILLIGQLFTVNYSDLSWSSNNASYLGLIAMILLILSQFVSNREEQKTALK